MIDHERSLEIEATPDTIWAVPGRFMHSDAFAPAVRSVDALTQGDTGVGAQRRCSFDNGTSMVEEVIEWQPGQGYRVRLFDMDAIPLNEAIAGIAVAPVGDGRLTQGSTDILEQKGPGAGRAQFICPERTSRPGCAAGSPGPGRWRSWLASDAAGSP